ncbi:MAG: putative zinc-binding protein [Candidatus Bathyarchaeia archaeon]
MKPTVSQHKKIIVIPCSGIGKAFGSISREATYEVVENLRKDVTQTLCLALLVSGDQESLQLVRNNKVVTVDGCPLQCAAKNVKLASGNLAGSLRVVDAYKENRHLKPRGVTFLDNDGQQMALALAEKIATKVDELLGKQ